MRPNYHLCTSPIFLNEPCKIRQKDRDHESTKIARVNVLKAVRKWERECGTMREAEVVRSVREKAARWHQADGKREGGSGVEVKRKRAR